MIINSKDYHDYVIKDGVLIGEFDQMYQNIQEPPWNQEKQESWPDVKITMSLLRGYGPFRTIVDMGCGLGYYLDILSELSTKDGSAKLLGYDISGTACKRASKLFPDAEFRVMDLCRAPQEGVIECSSPSLHVIRGTIWYVVDHLPEVLSNIYGMMPKGGLLVLSQNFPPLERDYYGKKIIGSPDDLHKILCSKFKPLEFLSYQKPNTHTILQNENWFIGVYSKERV